MLRKGDVVLLLIVVFCVLLGVVLNNDNTLDTMTIWNNLSGQRSYKSELVAIIKKDDVILKTIDLSKLKKRELIKTSGLYSATIAAEYNRICFWDTNCPDRICVNTGWLTKPGDLAVCLPNKTIIKIRLKNNTDLDGVVR